MNYTEWLKSKWLETGGLISQAQAAQMLDCSRNTVKDMVKDKRLKGYIFQEGDRPLVALSDILKIANDREKKKKEKEESLNHGSSHKTLSKP